MQQRPLARYHCNNFTSNLSKFIFVKRINIYKIKDIQETHLKEGQNIYLFVVTGFSIHKIFAKYQDIGATKK